MNKVTNRNTGWWRRGAAGLLLACAGTAAMLGADAVKPEPKTQEAPASKGDSRGAYSATGEPIEGAPVAPYNQRESLIARGREVYASYCIGCHGESGDGKGPASERLNVQPRDFTKGIYKFRSTDSGSLPLETDLHRTITRGLARVSMPGFPMMPEQDKTAVIAYIKSLYPRWDQEASQRKVVHVPIAPTDLADASRVGRGRVVYIGMGCGACHGIDGAGAGASQKEYTDAWGFKIRPLNFTRGRLKSGDDPEDIYRAFHTGLRSVMPSYGGTVLAMVTRDQVETRQSMMLPGELERLGDSLKDFPAEAAALDKLGDKEREELAERNSWDLVAFVMSLRKTPAAAAAAK